MEIGKIVGQVVATHKEKKLKGRRLLMVELLDKNAAPTGAHVVAVDSVGAGDGELVIIVRGSSARKTTGLDDVPTDTAIVAIIDSIEMEGKTIYDKAK